MIMDGASRPEQDGTQQGGSPGAAPRITALPGPSRLVRITEASLEWVRAIALEEEPPREVTEEQVLELEHVGLLIDSPDEEDGLILDPHWEQLLRSGLRSPVGAELVCVDGDRGWSTRLRIAGRYVLVIDQEREVLADQDTMRLGRRANAVLLGLATIEHLGALVRALVPQRPAFTDAEPAPFPAQLADAPAVAEVQMVVASAPTPEETSLGGGSWYALGRHGEQLAVLVPGEDGTEVREAAPGSLAAALCAKVIGAIDHVTAHGAGRAA
jgi:hypothetical protein